MKPFRLACIQLGSETADKEANLTLALDMMKEAATNGAHMVLLPEYALLRNFNKTTAEAEAEDFGCTPETDFESFDVLQSPSPTLRRLSAAANEHEIWLFAGSYPERCNGSIYNTMPVFNPTGQQGMRINLMTKALAGRLVTIYRKTHLCDLPFMDGVKESDFISSGSRLRTIETG